MPKNNPSLPVTETAGDHGGSAGGTLDSGDTGETAVLKDVTKAKEQAAPDNPPHTWNA